MIWLREESEMKIYEWGALNLGGKLKEVKNQKEKNLLCAAKCKDVTVIIIRRVKIGGVV